MINTHKPVLHIYAGHISWYLNNNVHRVGGPAIEWLDGHRE